MIQVPSKIGITKLIFKALLGVNGRRPETTQVPAVNGTRGCFGCVYLDN